jgi:hypothetical protein
MSAIANVQGMFAPRHQHSPKVPLAENGPNGFVPQFMPKDHDPYVFDDVQCLEATKAEDVIFNGNAEFKSVGPFGNGWSNSCFSPQNAEFNKKL